MQAWTKWSAAGLAAALIVAAGCVATQQSPPPAAAPSAAVRTVKIVAKKFDFTPSEITLKKGVAVDFELTALDREHGFYVPQLGLRAEIWPGKVTTVHFTPQATGTFRFQCDKFCGEGHEDMDGTITVVE